MKPLTLALAFALSLPLAACGGGGGGQEDDDQNPPVQETIESTGALDGLLTYNNQGDVPGGGPLAATLIGDGPFVQGGPGSNVHESLYSFDLSSVPSGAVITNATLRLVILSGANDRDMMGLIRLDHVRYGDTFPQIRGQVATIEFNFDTIDDLLNNGQRLIDVTAQVQDDVDASRGRSQFRARGAATSNNDGVADFLVLSSSDLTADPNLRPVLTIEYETP